MAARTVLVVEDEAGVRDVVEYALVRDGYRVLAAPTLSAARCAIEKDPPDCIILDLVLPGGSGLELLADLRRRRRTPVIILSSRDEDADVIAGLELGADDYLTKPFNPR